MHRSVKLNDSQIQHLNCLRNFSFEALNRAFDSKSRKDMNVAVARYSDLGIAIKDFAEINNFSIDRMMINSGNLKPISMYILEYVIGCTIAGSYSDFVRANHAEKRIGNDGEVKSLTDKLREVTGSSDRRNYGEVRNLVLSACATGNFELAIECLRYVRENFVP